MGFVFTAEDDVVGVDLDDCRDVETAEPTQRARDIIDRLDSYTEISPSGTGYHVLVRGQLPDGRNRKGAVEMYDSARFFTVTGDHVDGTPTAVEERTEALAAVHREYVQDESSTATGQGGSSGARPTALSDDDLLEKARSAANGEKFQHLWAGKTSGYESHSEADMALCCLLAFWTGGDRRRMDRLFRRSGLMREKWDEVHYADGTTYGEQTIARAVANTSEFYEPADRAEPLDRRDGSTSRGETTRGEATGDRDVAGPDDAVRDRLFAVETTLDHVESQLAALADDVARLESELAAERQRRLALAAQLESDEGWSLLDRFRR